MLWEVPNADRESKDSDMTILGGETWIKYSFFKAGSQKIISSIDDLKNNGKAFSL